MTSQDGGLLPHDNIHLNIAKGLSEYVPGRRVHFRGQG
jgi:hypothetical protein